MNAELRQFECFVDFKSPASWLAIEPTVQLASDLQATVLWRPYDTRQHTLAPARPDETVTERHFRVREQSRRRIHLHYAAMRGVPMSFPATPGATRTALAGLLIAREDPLTYLHDCFHAYWRDHADLDADDLVLGLLEGSGHRAASADLAAARTRLEETQAHAEEAGVFDAPMYVVTGQRFLGREHLPWIRELLLEL